MNRVRMLIFLLLSIVRCIDTHFTVYDSPDCIRFSDYNALPLCEIQDVLQLVKEASSCLKPPKDEYIYFHQYIMTYNHEFGLWNINDLLYSIQSFIITQDLNVSKLIVWTKSKLIQKLLKTNAYIKLHSLSIEIRIFDMLKEIKGSPLEFSKFTIAYSSDNRKLYMEYDKIIKYIILWKYSGIYYENNVLLLNDFQPLVRLG